MRTLLRTVLIIGVTSLGVLAILALSREINSPLAVDASIAQSIPEYPKQASCFLSIVT